MDGESPPSELVKQTLTKYGSLTKEALFREIPDLEPAQWLSDLVRAYPMRPGKHLRPSLCLATCRAFGGTVDDALLSAVAIEMLHNAFLVHDDIVDESLIRRGSATLHQEYGVGLALNAGDALAVLAFRTLRKNTKQLGSHIGDLVSEEFENMALQTLRGQAIELGWQSDGLVDRTSEDYLELVSLKTCWYTTILPLRVGALIGTWGRAPTDALLRFGLHLGAAFQIQDDLLNLVGDQALYGKEIAGDIYEGKRTLPIIHLRACAQPGDRDFLDRFLARRRAQRTADDADRVLGLLRRHGSIEYAQQVGRGVASETPALFEAAFADATPGADLDFIRQLTHYVLNRHW